MKPWQSRTAARAAGLGLGALTALAAACAPAGAPVPQPVHGVTHAPSSSVPTAAHAAADRTRYPRPDAVAAGYVGSDVCATCHRPEFLRFSASPRGQRILSSPRTALERLGCEACHGPGEAHVAVEGLERVPGFFSFARDDSAPIADRNEVCLQCHAGTKRIDWQGSSHELRDVACTDCHSIMAPSSPQHQLKRSSVAETCGQCHSRQMRTQQLAFSRMPVGEGKMSCTNCHNPHGSSNERLLVAPTVNEVCYSCHAEKRGPFLWEHAPVTESCATCHDPHGSRHEKMLVVPKPRLCQQCHVEQRHPTDPQRIGATRFVMGRQCVNCHFNIHGSNHPGGARFTR
jgi:DmsE family decaheme c-type cytochrome